MEASEPTTVVTDDAGDRKDALKAVGGSLSDNWNNLLANQAVRALWLGNSDQETRERQYSATVAALTGVGPRDELKGMLAAQVLASHNPAMDCYRRAVSPEQTFEGWNFGQIVLASLKLADVARQCPGRRGETG